MFGGGVVATGLLVAFTFRKIDLMKLLILGSDLYFSLYVVISGILLCFDEFTMLRTCGILFFGTFIADGILLWKQKGFRGITVRPALKKHLPLAIILALCSLVCWNRAGVYGTSQDQGLYQIRAMYYVGDRYMTKIAFPEYYNVQVNWEKQVYLDELRDMEGYYPESKEADTEHPEGMLTGQLHGVNTYPALLALWGKMFSVSAMSGILTVFYLLTIGNIWMVAENIKHDTVLRICECAICAVSPVLIWCAQVTVPEIVIAVFISMFFMLMTEKKAYLTGIASAIPLVALCWYHVSVSVLMPGFVLIYLLCYLISRRKEYPIGLIVLMTGYVSGFYMMWTVSRQYTEGNMEAIFRMTKGIVHPGNLFPLILTGSLILIGTSVWLLLRKEGKGRKAGNGKLPYLTVRAVLTGEILFFLRKAIGVIKIDFPLGKMSIVGFWLMSGFVTLPMACVYMWMDAKRIVKERKMAVLAFSVLYFPFIYAGTVYLLVYYYYYYARYFAPFLSLIVLMAGELTECIRKRTGSARKEKKGHRKKGGYIREIVIVSVTVIIVIITAIQNPCLLKGQDMTYTGFRMEEELAEKITDKDAVLIYDQGYHSQRLFMMQLKGLTGADIYFYNRDAYVEQLNVLVPEYENIYLLEYDLGEDLEALGIWENVYNGTMHTSLYNTFVEETLPYPTEIFDNDITVSMFQLSLP